MVTFLATWAALDRLKLINRQHIAGALGIEALIRGYLHGINRFHLLGPALLCL